MSEINILATAGESGIIEIIIKAAGYRHSSITIGCLVQNMRPKEVIATLNKSLFINVDDNGRLIPHGKRHRIDRELSQRDSLAVG